MKREVQAFVRRVHLLPARRLADRLGIYFHNLPRRQWDAFAAAIAYLRDHGYALVRPGAIAREDGGRAAFLSFDDNHQSWHEALPLFEALGVRATFYINTLPIRDRADAATIHRYYERIDEDPGRARPLSTAEIKELREAGHEIGSHGHSHAALSALPLDEAKREISTSKRLLEEIIGAEVVHFAYPFGLRRYFSEELRRYCLDHGFETVANAIPGLQFAGQRPDAIQRTPWNLERSVAYNVDTLSIDGRLFEKLTGRTAAAF